VDALNPPAEPPRYERMPLFEMRDAVRDLAHVMAHLCEKHPDMIGYIGRLQAIKQEMEIR